MKIKITLLGCKSNRGYHLLDENFILVYLNDDLQFPSRYIGVDNVATSIEKLSADYFALEYKLLGEFISGFRQVSPTEYEVVYSCYLPVAVSVHKSGDFHNFEQIQNLSKPIDNFYIDILAQQRR